MKLLTDLYSFADASIYLQMFVFFRQQSEEGDRNGSEEEDEEKPGKRVMGPRKKFIWDDKLRSDLRKTND